MEIIKIEKFPSIEGVAKDFAKIAVGDCESYLDPKDCEKQIAIAVDYGHDNAWQQLETMDFGDAIKALKHGSVVRRLGWDCLSLVVIKQIPAHITGEIIPKMQSLPESAKRLVMKNATFVDYTDQCLIYNKDTGEANSWAPTISDVFAEDWVIVSE